LLLDTKGLGHQKKNDSKTLDKFSAFLNHIYMQSVEGRSDWLAIQTIATAEFLKVPLTNLPQLAK
jgi:hypothetical protein